jgi:50S ribosome-binding GTPase
MLDFIRLLIQRYRTVHCHARPSPTAGSSLNQQLHSLTLTEAFLEKGLLQQSHPKMPIQIAVMGPTQAGKSSAVNLLLQRNLAVVSPLAGFTVHPQGFSRNSKEDDPQWLLDYFSHYQRFERGTLPPERHDCYVYASAGSDPSHPLPPCVIWDTPDFDSIDAEGYRESVLRCAALADVILLLVSKDKYADQSVWDMMSLLEPLGQPTVICLNKILEENRLIILRSLQQKWKSARSDAPAALTALPYRDPADVPTDASQQALAHLFEDLNKAITAVERNRHPQQAYELLKQHWTAWLAPITAEHDTLIEWRALVDQAVKQALTMYRRDYLDHPHHYETFKRALAELLTLLEIPGLATALARTRQAITWPVRQLVKLAKRERREDGAEQYGQEMVTLKQIQEHLFIQLADRILVKSEEEFEQARWWKEMGRQLRTEKPVIASEFLQTMQHYERSFQPEIEASAHQLYNKLKQQPATLNSLRATRITTDAAAVALALKTGGIGLHDFILTPAVLSLTSMLAESALGSHMNKIAAKLKQRQFEIVERDLFNNVLQKQLLRLPQRLDDSEQFNIPLETLQAAEDKLEQSRYGLRLL